MVLLCIHLTGNPGLSTNSERDAKRIAPAIAFVFASILTKNVLRNHRIFYKLPYRKAATPATDPGT